MNYELLIYTIAVLVVGAFLSGLVIMNFLITKEISDELRRQNLINLLNEKEEEL